MVIQFDHIAFTTESLVKDVKGCFEAMRYYGGKNENAYDRCHFAAYELLTVLSMRLEIDDFVALKKEYYCAVYDGDLDDEENKEI